jgi:hypothetical protein
MLPWIETPPRFRRFEIGTALGPISVGAVLEYGRTERYRVHPRFKKFRVALKTVGILLVGDKVSTREMWLRRARLPHHNEIGSGLLHGGKEGGKIDRP